MTRSTIVLLAVLVGCGGDPGPSGTDGGSATDAATLADGGGEGDAAADDASMGEDGGNPAVEECRTLALAVAAECGGQADRTCEWNAWADICAEQDPAVLAEAMQCLLDGSTGTGSCRTFADPSGTDVCIGPALADEVSTEEQALADAIVAQCTTTTAEALLEGRFALPIAAMSATAVTRTAACVAVASSCDAASQCLFDEIPDAVACYTP